MLESLPEISALVIAQRSVRRVRKVLHILHALHFSGAEIMLKIAAPAFLAQGLELHILSDSPAYESDYATTLAAAGYTLHYLPCVEGQRPDLGAVRRFLRQHRFDAVHNHTEQNFLWYSFIARQVGVPRFVHTVHANFNFAGLVRVKRAAYRLLARQLLGVQFIAISPSVQETEQRANFNPTMLVPNWVNAEHFVPARSAAERDDCRRALGLRPEQFVLVSVGSCLENKNHHDIFTALGQLDDDLAARTVYLHIGDGPLNDAEQICVRGLALRADVRFLGQLHDVRPALIASDLFLMTSRFEGLGMSLLEAQSCALTAVVYDASGLRDLVRDRDTGRLVPPTPAHLAAAIAELAAAPDERVRLGQAGYEQSQEQFSLARSLQLLLDLYEPV